MNQKLLMNFVIAVEAVMANRMRSILTGLGIIFGVAAVIAMLAIGNGAQQEILEQIKLVGVNNIVIKPVVKQSEEKLEEEEEEEASKAERFSPGLSTADREAIADIVPGVQVLSPEITLDTYIINNGIRRSAKLVGVEPGYFEVFNFELERGDMFSAYHLQHGEPVCVIGKSIKTKFFPTEDPIGKYIKCGNNWLKVIGILKERLISTNSISNLGIRDYNMDVYIPIQSMLIRYKNRGLITKELLRKANSRGGSNNNNNSNDRVVNYHQLDRLVVQVAETEKINATADVISRMLQRRHYDVVDFEIEIPELLLKQQQRTNDIFNYVLGAIAGISLLVGGIGIMNIMLASVLERIKEIGLRLSLGAKKLDIISQFLFEAMMISVTGGLIGVVLGVAIALLVSAVADIPTVVTFTSIILSFGVAAGVGLIFGIAPAKKAASQDPIQSLRYE
ncbi:ABC transporter permease [Marinoscillum furvescens]|uniref:Putative ABC transport system permease protein n=1 Tax=Marinoscillum furvescens DSM 4134 TaxID=1122208 RepID=A0A3D9L2X7_MARFU|nr:ABC transporter permease [Marinoscillum furvescens]RED96132.1 putative ABC transport system permease protein [Marinoscillum furvescens DSM 4134]